MKITNLFVVVLLTPCVVAPSLDAQSDFIRGDCNVDGSVDIGDVLWIIQLAWIDGPPPLCEAACEADGDGVLNYLVDAISLLQYLYDGAPPPPAPFPDCGPDATSGILCSSYDCDAAGPTISGSFVLSMPQAVQGTGIIAKVPVDLEVSPDFYAVGWSYGICHDNADLSLEQVILGDTLVLLNGGDGPDFNVLSLHDDGWTSAVIVDIFGLDALEGSSQLRKAEYTVLAPLGTTTLLQFCETLGDPPVTLSITSGFSTTDIPTTVDGSVEVVPAFRRGDADADGFVNVLLDSIYLLAFGFQGGPPPPCDDAVDVDDSGSLNSLADGLALLTYGFLGGPPPPSPGIVCGADPTTDALGCESYGDCP